MAYSEYAMENINIEESKILFENKWHSLDELKKQIKTKVNSEDYNVVPIANAVQELSRVLDNITSIKLTLHVDLIKSYKELAEKSGTGFENILRDALISRVDYGLTSNMSKTTSATTVQQVTTEERRDSNMDVKIEDDPAYKPKKVACRNCKAVIVVESPERPITITCPECGTKGKLSK